MRRGLAHLRRSLGGDVGLGAGGVMKGSSYDFGRSHIVGWWVLNKLRVRNA